MKQCVRLRRTGDEQDCDLPRALLGPEEPRQSWLERGVASLPRVERGHGGPRLERLFVFAREKRDLCNRFVGLEACVRGHASGVCPRCVAGVAGVHACLPLGRLPAVLEALVLAALIILAAFLAAPIRTALFILAALLCVLAALIRAALFMLFILLASVLAALVVLFAALVLAALVVLAAVIRAALFILVPVVRCLLLQRVRLCWTGAEVLRSLWLASTWRWPPYPRGAAVTVWALWSC